MPSPTLVGILLAAGSGRRFGGDKLRHPLADGTPLALAAACRLAAVCDRTLAVIRPGDDALAALLAGAGCTPLPCADAAAGMGRSLAAGVAAAAEADAWLVALADMPCIAPQTYARVAAALRGGAPLAAPFHDGRRGHPVGFAQRWRGELLRLDGDSGARALLSANAGLIAACAVDDAGILRDVDTVADLEDLPPAGS